MSEAAPTPPSAPHKALTVLKALLASLGNDEGTSTLATEAQMAIVDPALSSLKALVDSNVAPEVSCVIACVMVPTARPPDRPQN